VIVQEEVNNARLGKGRGITQLGRPVGPKAGDTPQPTPRRGLTLSLRGTIGSFLLILAGYGAGNEAPLKPLGTSKKLWG